jgi:hypothetical protein
VSETLADLEQRYPDAESRKLLFGLFNIVVLLRESIITKGYRVPPEMHEPIALTEYGQNIYAQLRRRNVPHPEARMLCLLEIFHDEIMVDIAKTNQNAIIDSISAQMMNGTMPLVILESQKGLAVQSVLVHEDSGGSVVLTNFWGVIDPGAAVQAARNILNGILCGRDQRRYVMD